MKSIAYCLTVLLVLMGCSSKADRELVLAASEGRLTQVRMLLDGGANVNYRLPDDGTTALIAAARNGHLNVVEALARRGADINAVDHDVGAALYWAAFNGKIDVMKFLLGRGGQLKCNSKAAAYLLKTIRDRGLREVEDLTRDQLRQEGLSVA